MPPQKRQRKTKEVSTTIIEDWEMPNYLQERRKQFKESKPSLVPNYAGIEQLEADDEVATQVLPDFGDGDPYDCDLSELGDEYQAIPDAIARWLRPYQLDGAVALRRAFLRQRGLILGDDMGLGKTVQVIAFLASIFGKSGDVRDRHRMRLVRQLDRWYPRVLIICPGTILENWQRELSTWGYWVIDIFHGANKADVLNSANAGRLEVMITTYKTYQLNESDINIIQWDCCILDECHQIKQAMAGITIALMKVNSLCRIGLTGTAIQNSYEDLWTLLNWANPGELGSRREWTSTISRPLKAGQAHTATIQELARARITARRLVENVLPRFFLRRTKELIADQLPQKRDLIVFCKLSKLQQQAYHNYLKPDDSKQLLALLQPCTCENSTNETDRCTRCRAEAQSHASEHFLAKCTTSLKLVDHLALIFPRNEDAPKDRERALERLKLCLPEIWQKYYDRSPILNHADPNLCGKWKVLQYMLVLWKSKGDKVLIFSYSTRMLTMIERLFSAQGDYSFCRLDGSMKYDERQRQVDKFNTDPNQFVFLLSTKAGGVGLNIVSANRVVIWDLNWNPTYDLQAQDRAFRIGQKRDVEVYRFVSSGTIEEIVYARQIYKQQQANIGYNASLERRYFDGVMGEVDRKGEIFGLKNLFAYSKDNVLLQKIVNKTNIAEAMSAEIGVDIEEIDLQNVDIPAEAAREDGNADESNNDDDDDHNMEKNIRSLMMGSTEDVKSSRPRTDPISAILNHAGVKYIHDNAQVIGTSKIEERLSRHAMAVRATHTGADKQDIAPVFADASPAAGISTDVSATNKNGQNRSENSSNTGKHKFNPPPAVRRRQFNSMAKFFSYDSPTDFALFVEQLSQTDRQRLLERFYASLDR
ncbi:P-loop containing nucleoside triphosphate hydrolase protein [Limtongia smithiae]|uniref:P-loop containing nucleoside triphosphate hydrolase protein n=1 Tax=Limtongia smithiae TaxID=1125753 RepID=UPI0034D01FEB